MGLSVISPVCSFLVIHISRAVTRKALGKRIAWLLPVLKTLALACIVDSFSLDIQKRMHAVSLGRTADPSGLKA